MKRAANKAILKSKLCLFTKITAKSGKICQSGIKKAQPLARSSKQLKIAQHQIFYENIDSN